MSKRLFDQIVMFNFLSSPTSKKPADRKPHFLQHISLFIYISLLVVMNTVILILLPQLFYYYYIMAWFMHSVERGNVNE